MTDRQAQDRTPQTSDQPSDQRSEPVSELDVSGADQQDSVGTVNPAGLESDPDRDELEELRANLADMTHEEPARLEEAEKEQP